MMIAWLAAAWLAGIAASATFGGDAWPLAPALGAATAAYALVQRNVRIMLFALALPALLAAGAWREQSAHRTRAHDDVAAFHGGPAMSVRGVLRDDPDRGDTSQRFAVDIRDVRVRGEWLNASGGVHVRAPLLPRYRAGDVIELEGEIARPPQVDGFDYAEYLAQRGIASVMDYPRLRVVGHDAPPWWRSTVLRVRRELSRGLGLALEEPHASLAQGVLLGQRSALSPDLRDDLNATNTSHLVVVSGSNVIYVSSFVTMTFAWIVGRRRALVLSIVAVLAYATLVGLSPPVFRATVMGVLLVIARASGRRTSGMTSILLAAAVMAGITPSILRDVSFQLSFAATAGIIYLASPVRRACVEVLGWLLRRDEVPRPFGALLADPLSVTLAAVVATAPLVALHFERVSLVALPANMLIVPVFPLILGASLLAAAGGLIPHLHLALGVPAYALLAYWMAVAHWFAEAPASSAGVREYSTLSAIATYLALAAAVVAAPMLVKLSGNVMLAPSRPIAWRRLGSVASLAVPAATLAVSAAFVFFPDSPRRMQVTVLDVGQGDAILIEAPDGRDVLVDGGPGAAVLRALGSELAWHDRSIEVVVLTHAQADHGTGLIDVLARYDVGSVVAGPGVANSTISAALAASATKAGLAIRTVRAGDVIDLGERGWIEILWPDAGEPVSENPNDSALVLRVVYGDVSFLLASDIEQVAERALLARGVDVSATVLKAPHHGSKTSSTSNFLEAVLPRLSAISAGSENRFGHPAAEVVDRLDDYGPVYLTSQRGSVRIETDGRRVWVHTER